MEANADIGRNIDPNVVEGFGREWNLFDQRGIKREENERTFRNYFRIFPWESLPASSEGADLGCGSGRWAVFVAPRVRTLHLIDASPQALEVAKRNLSGFSNALFHQSSINEIPLRDASLDFAYSLGVLHHIPDTRSGIQAIAEKLKPGAPFLIYIYCAFENQSSGYRFLWRLSDLARRFISKRSFVTRRIFSELMAALVSYPLARTALVLERLEILPKSWPLQFYRHRSFYSIRNDSLDRFGTRLEKRFSKEEIIEMLSSAGFENISFSNQAPYWCAVAYKRSIDT